MELPGSQSSLWQPVIQGLRFDKLNIWLWIGRNKTWRIFKIKSKECFEKEGGSNSNLKTPQLPPKKPIEFGGIRNNKWNVHMNIDVNPSEVGII